MLKKGELRENSTRGEVFSTTMSANLARRNGETGSIAERDYGAAVSCVRFPRGLKVFIAQLDISVWPSRSTLHWTKAFAKHPHHRRMRYHQ